MLRSFGKRPRPPRTFDRKRRVIAPPTFSIQELVKLADRGQTAPERRRAQLLRVAGGDKPAHMQVSVRF